MTTSFRPVALWLEFPRVAPVLAAFSSFTMALWSRSLRFGDVARPKTGEDIRTFCVLTCELNEMTATIHNRMLAIWVLPTIVDSSWMRTRDLLKPFAAGLMTMWPINRKVGSPKNDRPDILDREEPIRTDLFN